MKKVILIIELLMLGSQSRALAGECSQEQLSKGCSTEIRYVGHGPNERPFCICRSENTNFASFQPKLKP